FDRGPAIGIDLTARRDTRIALGPKFPQDSGVGHSARPEDQSIGFKRDALSWRSRVFHARDLMGDG
ncbi:hypothetical protein, partial [Klebsiella pneumoniae]|uniref:hypothetical protein n=1 Tax=Klebsiella pneumoniae TaxID=573 RepID=UPI0039C32966